MLVTLFLGDLNAKVGKCNVGIEHIMGREGLVTKNDNGYRLIDFCTR